jgi:hypothetical protein
MTSEEVEDVVQDVVEKELNPVHFGGKQKMVLWVILACSIISSVASLTTLLVLAI